MARSVRDLLLSSSFLFNHQYICTYFSIYSPYHKHAKDDALRTVHQHGQRVLLILVRQHRSITHHSRQQVNLKEII